MAKRVMVRWQVTETYQAVITVDEATDVTDDVLAQHETNENWEDAGDRMILESSEVEDDEEEPDELPG